MMCSTRGSICHGSRRVRVPSLVVVWRTLWGGDKARDFFLKYCTGYCTHEQGTKDEGLSEQSLAGIGQPVSQCRCGGGCYLPDMCMRNSGGT